MLRESAYWLFFRCSYITGTKPHFHQTTWIRVFFLIRKWLIIEASLNGQPTDRKSWGWWIYDSFSLSLPCNQDNGSLNMTSFLYIISSERLIYFGYSGSFLGIYWRIFFSDSFMFRKSYFVAVRVANGALKGGGRRLIRSIRMTWWRVIHRRNRRQMNAQWPVWLLISHEIWFSFFVSFFDSYLRGA